MFLNPRVLAWLLAMAGLTATAASNAACNYPHAPGQFPDGNTASLEEMLAAKKSVATYMADMDAYIKCVDEENPPVQGTAPITEAQKKEQEARERVRAQKHNAAVADEEAVADRFNVQLRAFKARPPKS